MQFNCAIEESQLQIKNSSSIQSCWIHSSNGMEPTIQPTMCPISTNPVANSTTFSIQKQCETLDFIVDPKFELNFTQNLSNLQHFQYSTTTFCPTLTNTHPTQPNFVPSMANQVNIRNNCDYESIKLQSCDAYWDQRESSYDFEPMSSSSGTSSPYSGSSSSSSLYDKPFCNHHSQSQDPSFDSVHCSFHCFINLFDVIIHHSRYFTHETKLTLLLSCIQEPFLSEFKNCLSPTDTYPQVYAKFRHEFSSGRVFTTHLTKQLNQLAPLGPFAKISQLEHFLRQFQRLYPSIYLKVDKTCQVDFEKQIIARLSPRLVRKYQKFATLSELPRIIKDEIQFLRKCADYFTVLQLEFDQFE